MARAFVGITDLSKATLLFAAGVSNSAETNPAAFAREKRLVHECARTNDHFVYFSTCSIYDKSLILTPYVLHKLEIEEIVSKRGNSTIFRLPQVVGKTRNRNTLTNYLYDKIVHKESFDIWEYSTRNLIDVDDIVLFVIYFLNRGFIENAVMSRIINISNPTSVFVIDIVRYLERITGIEAYYNIVPKGSRVEIDSPEVSDAARIVGIDFSLDYCYRVLRKYYNCCGAEVF